MPVRIEPQAEPIPGYKLIERLGAGGFGEVWKAEAPGGLLKAIKFVHGDLDALDDTEGARAGQELKAMDRVRKVRHAYILSIERFEIIEGQLIIVTELADRTLWDRFRECNRDGMRGIPREELLGYMSEVAEALDFMNEEYDLQHLDIKPQNLFLVHKHVKVADFGLAKDLGGKAAATVTGGVTPVYAAPETFDGWLSRFSDQYSLAIVYQELLTGKRPFSGGSMRQLVMQHLQATPDLSDLPACDHPVVARALAKDPEARFPHCVEFIKTLGEAGFAKPTAREPAALELAPVPFPSECEDKPSAEEEAAAPTVRPGDPEWGDGERTEGVRAKGKSRPRLNLAPPAEPDVLPERPQGARPQKGRTTTTPIRSNDTPSLSSPIHESVKTSLVGRSKPSDHGTRICKGIGQPALVIGLGQIGLSALQHVRGWLQRETGPDATPFIRLLGIDIDPAAPQLAGQAPADESLSSQAPSAHVPAAGLRNTEVVVAKLHRPAHYLKAREGVLPLDSWLNTRALYRIPRQLGGAGLRSLGRLALVDNFRLISRRLENELQACAAPQPAPQEPQEAEGADLVLRTAVPRVYIIAGLGGNTGSGMFLDVAYLARHHLRKLGLSQAEIIGVFLLPPTIGEGICSTALANAHAALLELKYFSASQMFTARYEGKESGKPFVESGPPFHRAVVLQMPDRVSASDEPKEVLSITGQFLFRDLATPLGIGADSERCERFNSSALLGQAVFQTFGMYRICWPRRRLLNQAANRLCHRLVEGWMSKDARVLSAPIRKWSAEQWDALGLRAESLITRHQDLCEKRMKQAPDSMFQALVHPLVNLLKPSDKATRVGFGPVVQAMEQIDQLLGAPDEGRPPGAPPPEPGLLETALAESAAMVAEECEQKLAEVIVRLIEQPTYRLAGAEECLRQMAATVGQALEAQEQLAKELQERALQLHQRIVALVEQPIAQDPKYTPRWSFMRKTPPNSSPGSAANEMLDLLKAYPKCRYQSLILAHINHLYVALRGHLSDQVREVGFCRARLVELAGLFKEPAQPKKAKKAPKTPHEQALLPPGCEDLREASAQLEQGVGREDFLAFDQQVQAVIKREYRALVQICLGPSHVVRELAPLLLREAEGFLEPRLQGGNVAEMFLQHAGADRAAEGKADTTDGAKAHGETNGKTDGSPDLTAAKAALAKAVAAAAPDVGADSGVSENVVVVLPEGPESAAFESLVKEVLPGVRIVPSPRCDEVVIYRERVPLTLANLEQTGSVAQEAYRQKLAVDPGSLHTREDIEAWHFTPALEMAKR
ncbi:MAG: protein kinase [Planctomycetes bacterium]|nr:protein kinase [Planctomycetota bacterium]